MMRKGIVGIAIVGSAIALGTITGCDPDMGNDTVSTTLQTTHVPGSEDKPGWDCTRQGNQVCGPHHGPNKTDHNVYYGKGALPHIPGMVTTRP